MGSVGGGGEHHHHHQQQQSPRLLSIPKEGERILAPTRRPDGTLRKPVRIRAGYVPQDEVAIYQSKGAILRKEAQSEYPPGYDPSLDAKPKTKSAKRNERKKEKKHQAALASLIDKGEIMDPEQADTKKTEDVPSIPVTAHRLESVESVTDQINNLSVSLATAVPSPSTDSTENSKPEAENSKPEASGPDLDKRIRALKKKIRLAEAQVKGDQQHMNPEQSEKMAKVEGWRKELKLLEDEKAKMVS